MFPLKLVGFIQWFRGGSMHFVVVKKWKLGERSKDKRNLWLCLRSARKEATWPGIRELEIHAVRPGSHFRRVPHKKNPLKTSSLGKLTCGPRLQPSLLSFAGTRNRALRGKPLAWRLEDLLALPKSSGPKVRLGSLPRKTPNRTPGEPARGLGPVPDFRSARVSWH